ncbi:hypothetical protein QW060_24650, partial [Myroides ceti]|nr:hypothetical protein [Paenimyroides ceti]
MGVSLYYPLGNSWAVNSGITYTKLSSDLYLEVLLTGITADSRLHYIGVSASADLYYMECGTFDNLCQYGCSVEKVVYGTLKTDYIVDSVLQESTLEKDQIKNDTNFLNAGLGVNYSITDHVGIYFEPGIRYHFDDKSTVYTIYKDKPLN